jgi:hypothetical protein
MGFSLGLNGLNCCGTASDIVELSAIVRPRAKFPFTKGAAGIL